MKGINLSKQVVRKNFVDSEQEFEDISVKEWGNQQIKHSQTLNSFEENLQ